MFWILASILTWLTYMIDLGVSHLVSEQHTVVCFSRLCSTTLRRLSADEGALSRKWPIRTDVRHLDLPIQRGAHVCSVPRQLPDCL